MKTFDFELQTDLVILDFSKAFDTVPHKKVTAQTKQLWHKWNHS
jgi:hypothetical protein